MRIRYAHTCIIARDWRRLADFYEQVFGCTFLPPEKELSGDWVERITGVTGAHLCGGHLRLPGHGETGPTLEIYEYRESLPGASPAANREGLGHLAFEVEDVERTARQVLDRGGSRVGEIVSFREEGGALRTIAYLADPEGNIVELQSRREG
jgi:predicted enzyme related to lactoylglutathione lyase